MLFDGHCHIYLPEYDADREAVFTRMREKDMRAIVIGTNYEESIDALNLARQHDFLWATIGLHPNDNPEEDLDSERYRDLARDPKVVAIGECGLDYYKTERSAEEKQKQKERFEKQVQLAKELDKPLMIHCRSSQGSVDAQEDMIEILKTHDCGKPGGVHAVMHFFTSTPEIAQKYLDLGCYLSFPGVITFTNMYDECVRLAPLDRILSETDAPFAAPVPYRGKRNEPAYVEETVKRLAELKNISLEDMQAHIAENAKRFFKI